MRNDSQRSAARLHLTKGNVDRIVAALLKLAIKGQSSKDRAMRRAAGSALANLAYISPDLVLPEVHRHFVTALATVTAARQYAGAIQTLSLCIRPLLLAGLPPNSQRHIVGSENNMYQTENQDSITHQGRLLASQHVVDALMATLPCIDANDPPKTLATFRLYCAVLSSVGELPEDPSASPHALPLYTDAWAEEFLSRVFAILSNLDMPETGAGEHAGSDALGEEETDSFLLDGNSMFRPLMELLYVRLPGQLRASAIKRTAAFLLENVFSSSEGTVLCNAIAWADPSIAEEYLFVPLLDLLMQDLEAIVTSTHQQLGEVKSSRMAMVKSLSKVQETSLKWRLGLLSSTSFHMGKLLVRHGTSLQHVLTSLIMIPSQSVQEACSRAISSILVGLATFYPLNQYEECGIRLIPESNVRVPVNSEHGTESVTTKDFEVLNGNGFSSDSTAVECFIDKYGLGKGSENLEWHEPSEDEISLANEFLMQFLAAPAHLILSLHKGSNHKEKVNSNFMLIGNVKYDIEMYLRNLGSLSSLSKEVLRSLLLQMEGAFSGARSCLPDFSMCNSSNVKDFVGVVGSTGATIGSSELRELVCEALITALKTISPSDSDTLALCLRVMDHCLSIGIEEFGEASEGAGAWASDEKWTAEPAVSGLLLENLGDISMKLMSRKPSECPPCIRDGEVRNIKNVCETRDSIDTAQSKDSLSGTNIDIATVGYGKKWRRRRPRWITIEKVFLGLQWRASQAHYRWFASASNPKVLLENIPSLYLKALGEVINMVTQGPAGTWEVSAGILERSMKRYPVLSYPIFASLFAALAKLPEQIVFEPSKSIVDVLPYLQKAFYSAGVTAAAAGSKGGEAESEAEQAMVIGPASLFTGQSMWRLLNRDMEALHAFCLALIAGAAHVGAKAQLTITLIFLTSVFRYLPPPLKSVKKESGDICSHPLDISESKTSACEPSRIKKFQCVSDVICHDAIMVTSPNIRPGSLPLPWRFATGANSLPLLVIHCISPAMSYTLVKHYLENLTNDVILTRQVAVSGLNLMLQPLWNERMLALRTQSHVLEPEIVPDARIVESAKAAVESILGGNSDVKSSDMSDKFGKMELTKEFAALNFASRLFYSLSLSHPALSADESQAERALSMSRDNAYVRTLSLSLSINSDWPRTRMRSESVSAGHFIPSHARLIQVLCLASPEKMVSALRDPIEAALAKPQDEDRPAVATAAECLAGIISSGVAWTVFAETDGDEGIKSNDLHTKTAWATWVRPAFCRALALASLDWAMSLWGGAALRFVIFELSEAKQDEYIHCVLNEVLELTAIEAKFSDATLDDDFEFSSISCQSNPDSMAVKSLSSNSIYKQLYYASHAIQEIGNLSGFICAPESLLSFISSCINILPAAIQIPGDLTRQAAAGLMADTAVVMMESVAARGGKSDDSDYFRKFVSDRKIISEERIGMAIDGSDSEVDTLIHTESCKQMPSRKHSISSDLWASVLKMLDSVFGKMEKATETLYKFSKMSAEDFLSNPHSEVFQFNPENGEKLGRKAKLQHDHVPSRKQQKTSNSGGSLMMKIVPSLEAPDKVIDNFAVSDSCEAEDPKNSTNVDLATMFTNKDSGNDEMMEENAAEIPMNIDSVSGKIEGKGNLEYNRAITSVSFGVELAVQLLACNSAAISPWIVRFLPSLLRVQELVPSELQFVSMTSRKAFVAAKYQRFEDSDAQKILHIVLEAMKSDLWSERAASLAFVQYFWFRHAMVLGFKGTGVLVQAVENLLADEKQEVRELASVTLSGVIRGLPENEAKSLREKYVERALQLMPCRRRRRRNGSSTENQVSSIAQRHGAALALKAFVLSSPYDVPGWLPGILMALVKLSSEPPPVRTAVTSALAEFRRTHPEEDGGLFEVKDALNAEQWEAIRDASTNPASYFV